MEATLPLRLAPCHPGPHLRLSTKWLSNLDTCWERIFLCWGNRCWTRAARASSGGVPTPRVQLYWELVAPWRMSPNAKMPSPTWMRIALGMICLLSFHFLDSHVPTPFSFNLYQICTVHSLVVRQPLKSESELFLLISSVLTCNKILDVEAEKCTYIVLDSFRAKSLRAAGLQFPILA